MEKIILKPIKANVDYQGRFAELAFSLLTSPIDLYKHLIEYLGKYGASIQNINYEAEKVADANVNLTLLELGLAVRISLEGLQITLINLETIGNEVANQILLDVYGAIQKTSSEISFVNHTVTISSDVKLANESYDSMIRKYLNHPEPFGDKTTGGVVFYLSDGLPLGEEEASITLDRSNTLLEEGAHIKVAISLNATEVPIESLSQRVVEFHNRCLEHLNLKLEREK